MSILLRILKLLRPYSPAIAGGLACLLLSTGAMLIQPVLWQKMVDEVLIAGDVARFKAILLLMIAAGLLGALAGGLRSWLMERAAQKFVLDLRRRVHAHLQAQPLSFFHERRTGDLLARAIGDVDTLQEVAINGTDTFLSNILGMIGVSAIMIWYNWQLGLLTVAPVFLTFTLMYRYNRKVKPVYRAARDKLGDVSSRLQENLSGVQTVKAFAREEQAAGRFQHAIASYFAQNLLGISLRVRYMPAIQFLSFVGSVIMIGYGAHLILRNEMTIGVLLAYRGYWWHLYGPVYTIANINDLLQRASASGSRIFELLDHEPELRDAPDAKELPRIRGGVRFENVSFAYPLSGVAGAPAAVVGTLSPDQSFVGTKSPDHPAAVTPRLVFRELNLHVAPGTRVGVVGASGAGKSTLLSLIPRFFDPQQGRVVIDGVDVRGVTQRSLRRQIGMVLQESFLFNDSVLENIRFGRPDATREEAERAARDANAHEFIERLPQAYDTLVGERGVKLSGGQRQRIAIARAFLADPAILLLDEATSAVEPESETIIQQALERLMSGRTAFIVSHRLSAVRSCDLIAVIDGQRIAEQGTHQELLERGGIYAQMHRLQMGEEQIADFGSRILD